eukprot:5756982-Amphidinium_carterae.1
MHSCVCLEPRMIADTVSPVEEGPPIYRDCWRLMSQRFRARWWWWWWWRELSSSQEIIQARLDALQFDEQAYMWFEGKLGMTPCHRLS